MNGDNRHIERQRLGDDRLDLVIDAVAREMTEGEPSGALRARVLDEIAGGRRGTSRATLRWGWAATAAALVLAVATGVWVLNRPAAIPGEPVRAAASRLSAPAETPVVTPPAVTMGRAETAAPARVSRASASPGARSVESDAVADAHHVPALAEIDPLRFAAVEPAPLRIDAVDVAALPAIPTIEIPSLNPGSNESQSADPNKEK